MDADPKIEILTGKEGYDFRMRMHKEFVQNQFHPSDEIYEELGDWFMNMHYQGECGELASLFSETLYHINNDYFLSYYLQCPMIVPQPVENPFRAYFELWKMGLDVEIPEKYRVVLAG